MYVGLWSVSVTLTWAINMKVITTTPNFLIIETNIITSYPLFDAYYVLTKGDTVTVRFRSGINLQIKRSEVTYFNGTTEIPSVAVIASTIQALIPTSSGTSVTNNFSPTNNYTPTNNFNVPAVIWNQPPAIWTPIGTDLANITTATTMATNTCYALYLGKAAAEYSTCDIMFRCVTAAVGAITWAEIGIAKGTFVLNGNAALTRCGYVDVSGDVTATGTKKKLAVALSGIVTGDDLWFVAGGQAATTQWQTRGGIARDENQCGWAQTYAGRFSTMSGSQAFTLGAANLVPHFVQIKF